MKEGNDNTLTVTTKNPNNGDAAANAGYLIKLEKQEDGRYLIKSGLGNYFRNVGGGRIAVGSDICFLRHGVFRS